MLQMPFGQKPTARLPTGSVTGGEGGGGVQEENFYQVNEFEQGQGSSIPRDLSPGNLLSTERQDNRQTNRKIQLKTLPYCKLRVQPVNI